MEGSTGEVGKGNAADVLGHGVAFSAATKPEHRGAWEGTTDELRRPGAENNVDCNKDNAAGFG